MHLHVQRQLNGWLPNLLRSS